jgi:hypothetical protein
MTTNSLPTNGASRDNGEHLSEGLLNRYLDGDLAPAERQAADPHLAACDRCAARLSELTAISTLLSSLPEPRRPRSFQLDSTHARKPTSFWQRFGSALLPALPAMRAGTIAIALAFASVTAYRVVDDPGDTGTSNEDGGLQSLQMTSTSIAPAFTVEAAGRGAETAEVATESADQDQAADSGLADEAPAAEEEPFVAEESGSSASSELAPTDNGADAAPAGESDDASQETMTMFEAPDEAEAEAESAEPAADESTSLEMAQLAPEASPTAEASPAATATVTALPTATATATAEPVAPTPLPTEVPAPVAQEGSDDSSWLGWAQLLLGVTLVLLGGLVVGVQRLRRKVTG